jgi:hypothetical protein
MLVPGAFALDVTAPARAPWFEARSDGWIVRQTVPFTLDEPGDVYAKVIDVPQAAGPASHAWVEFSVRDDSGEHPLGRVVDDTPTRVQALAGGHHELRIVIHLPASAFDHHSEIVLHAIIAAKAPASPSSTSGASVDQARAFSIHAEKANAPPLPGSAVPWAFLFIGFGLLVIGMFVAIRIRRNRRRPAPISPPPTT